jgi:integrase
MARQAPRKLTEGFIQSLPLGTPLIVRDTKVTGLMVDVNRTCKSYKVQRDLWQGQRGRRTLVKTVRHTLGTTDELTLDQARLKAEDVIRQIKLGIDPNAPLAEQKAEGWTVDILFDEYAADLRKRECAERTVVDTLARRDRYLADWKKLPLTSLTRSLVRAKHHELTVERGKVTANHVMRDFRAAYNLALRVIDNPDLLPDNPVKAVTFNKERRKNAVIHPDDLPDWWAKIQALPNPLRRTMHKFGLYSGLRPGTLVALRREWINLKDRAIAIPKMKSGRHFDLPLSRRMVALVEQAIAQGDLLFPGSPWLFPTRANKDDPKRRIRHGQLIPTQVWRERSLPSETGHILRHTYRTIAQRIALDKIEARLLLDHTVPGIDGVYIHEKALFDRLLEAQERMSAAISQLRQPESVSAKPTLWLVDEVKRNARDTQRDEQNRSSAPPNETP